MSDVAVVEAFESGVLDLPDFCFTGDDCRYRFETETKRRFLDLLRERFNAGVRYNGRAMKWNTTIERKAVELSRYLVSRTEKLDFLESPQQGTIGDRDLSRQILNLSQSRAQRLGIGKSLVPLLAEQCHPGASREGLQPDSTQA